MRRSKVDITMLELTTSDSQLAAMHRLLSPNEVARARGFRVANAYKTFVLCRAALRLLLADRLKVGPENIRFSYTSSGKPYLSDSDTDLSFNVSHSGTRAAIALTSSSEVGIDIEEIREAADLSAVAEHVFAPEELGYLQLLTPSQWLACFYTLWTLKEAFVKAVGVGLAFDVRTARVVLDKCSKGLFQLHGAGTAEWVAQSIETEPGYAAAVVTASANPNCTIERPRLW
jgi:4'-phosphopantetheinyl transferase